MRNKADTLYSSYKMITVRYLTMHPSTEKTKKLRQTTVREYSYISCQQMGFGVNVDRLHIIFIFHVF